MTLVVLASLASALDLSETYLVWAEHYEAFYLDKLPDILAVMLMVFGWFSWRRWQEYRQEVLLRQVSEATLQFNQSRLTDLLEAASDRFWETDDQYRLVWRSRPGPPQSLDEEYLNKTRWQALGGDPKTDRIWADHFADLEARRAFRNVRYSRIRRGRIGHRSMSGKPFYDAQGAFLGYRGTSTDITEEVEAAHKAAETQAQFLSAIEDITDGYALWDADDRLIACNERFARLRGEDIDRAEPGVTFDSFMHAATVRAPSDGESDHWSQTFLARHRVSPGAFPVRHGNDWIEIREHHLSDGRILTVTRDITEQKMLEQQLQQAQKLKVVGQLTGGIAHDFNNLLQVILGNIEMIMEASPPVSKIGQQAAIAKTAADRGADLIRHLMAFSRQQTLQPEAFDLNHLVAEMSEMLRRTLGSAIEIRVQSMTAQSPVFLDRAQVEAAFLNIAINARDAMPNGGTLFVKTTDVLRGADESDQLEIGPGRYAVLSVTDTGTGMAPQVLARAFEPFFTTKDVGQGSGLGLSMIHGFVKQSGGDVKIHSECGIGTGVELYLPIAKTHEMPGDPRDTGASRTATGRETILLVEDEERVRIYAAAQLEQLGYRTIAVSDAAAALRIFQDLEGRIDLLFTDIIMPGAMDGRQLAESLQPRYPKLKVLYTSGNSEITASHDGKLAPGITLLEKPYHKAELAQKLRQVLDDDGNRYI